MSNPLSPPIVVSQTISSFDITNVSNQGNNLTCTVVLYSPSGLNVYNQSVTIPISTFNAAWTGDVIATAVACVNTLLASGTLVFAVP
jgi:hypothetical protein